MFLLDIRVYELISIDTLHIYSTHLDLCIHQILSSIA